MIFRINREFWKRRCFKRSARKFWSVLLTILLTMQQTRKNLFAHEFFFAFRKLSTVTATQTVLFNLTQFPNKP